LGKLCEECLLQHLDANCPNNPNEFNFEVECPLCSQTHQITSEIGEFIFILAGLAPEDLEDQT